MKKQTIALGFALALSLGLAGAAEAQQGTAPKAGERARGDSGWTKQKRDGGAKGARGMRGGRGLLMRGITLGDDQKARIRAIHEEQRQANAQHRDAMRSRMETVRAARQRGDTAAARQAMQEHRAQMQARHEAQLAKVRAVLTADQQRQFDANVAELKQRQAQRAERGGRGMGPGMRGMRGMRGPGGEHGEHGGRRGGRAGFRG